MKIGRLTIEVHLQRWSEIDKPTALVMGIFIGMALGAVFVAVMERL